MTEKRSPTAALYNVALTMQVICAPVMVWGVFYNPGDLYPSVDIKIGAALFLVSVLAQLVAVGRFGRK
jgi:hypothetical protein